MLFYCKDCPIHFGQVQTNPEGLDGAWNISGDADIHTCLSPTLFLVVPVPVPLLPLSAPLVLFPGHHLPCANLSALEEHYCKSSFAAAAAW